MCCSTSWNLIILRSTPRRALYATNISSFIRLRAIRIHSCSNSFSALTCMYIYTSFPHRSMFARGNASAFKTTSMASWNDNAPPTLRPRCLYYNRTHKCTFGSAKKRRFRLSHVGGDGGGLLARTLPVDRRHERTI